MQASKYLLEASLYPSFFSHQKSRKLDCFTTTLTFF